jgi:hypothetical protein
MGEEVEHSCWILEVVCTMCPRARVPGDATEVGNGRLDNGVVHARDSLDGRTWRFARLQFQPPPGLWR